MLFSEISRLFKFIDLGSAWNGAYDKIERPQMIYPGVTPDVTVLLKAGGIGPFVEVWIWCTKHTAWIFSAP
jgi:hypothetical protein